MPSTNAPTCIARPGALVGEGPVWLDRTQALLWTDIAGSALFLTYPDGRGTQRFATPENIAALAPRSRGGYVAATFTGLHVVDPDLAHWEALPTPRTDRLHNRFNDGKCDARGRLWLTSTHVNERERTGALHVIHPDGHAECVLDDLVLGNGLDWSPDGHTMYVTDSVDGVIWAFDFEAERCTLANRRALIRTAPGRGMPDGLCVDTEGYLWSANWGGHSVTRHTPGGRIDSIVRLPVSRPTSCAFGGLGMHTLLVTSASLGLSDLERQSEPDAGGVFALRTACTGRLPHAFAG